jgi:hypothetical protein
MVIMVLLVLDELDLRLVLQPSPWVTLPHVSLLLSMYKSHLAPDLNLGLLCYCHFHYSKSAFEPVH